MGCCLEKPSFEVLVVVKERSRLVKGGKDLLVYIFGSVLAQNLAQGEAIDIVAEGSYRIFKQVFAVNDAVLAIHRVLSR